MDTVWGAVNFLAERDFLNDSREGDRFFQKAKIRDERGKLMIAAAINAKCELLRKSRDALVSRATLGIEERILDFGPGHRLSIWRRTAVNVDPFRSPHPVTFSVIHGIRKSEHRFRKPRDDYERSLLSQHPNVRPRGLRQQDRAFAEAALTFLINESLISSGENRLSAG